MTLDRWTLVRTAAACVLGFGAFVTAEAQERMLFSFNSTVDREVIVVVRGRDVQVRGSGLDASYRPRVDVREGLPRVEGTVLVRRSDGRGNLQVIEQPSMRNGYSTTIRITDSRSGSDSYGFIAYWQPTRDGRYDDRGDRGRDDDRWDNRDRRRDDDRWDNRDRRREDDRCDHPNRNNGRGRDDDRCDDRIGRDRDQRNGSGILRWSGDVDDVSEIRITGRRVDYITRSGAHIRNARVEMRGDGLPRRDVNVVLGVSQGRGHVQVVQQPTRFNNYTAIVRVVDPRSGYGVYDFSLAWERLTAVR